MPVSSRACLNRLMIVCPSGPRRRTARGRCRGRRPRRRRARPGDRPSRRGRAPLGRQLPKGSRPGFPTVHSPKVNRCSGRGAYESLISGVLPCGPSGQPTEACLRRVPPGSGQSRYRSNDSVIRESTESCRESRSVSSRPKVLAYRTRGDAEAAEGGEMVRWGVIGPGAIAVGFADAMRLVDDGEIVAVASRSAERADAFGDRFGVPTRYDSYAALGEDPNCRRGVCRHTPVAARTGYLGHAPRRASTCSVRSRLP